MKMEGYDDPKFDNGYVHVPSWITEYERNKRKLQADELKLDNLMRAEDVRAKMNPEEYITMLHMLYMQADTCELQDLDRLKFKANILTTMLKKCLPDLKSIQTTEAQQTAIEIKLINSLTKKT
jgi:hypothetical protein